MEIKKLYIFLCINSFLCAMNEEGLDVASRGYFDKEFQEMTEEKCTNQQCVCEKCHCIECVCKASIAHQTKTIKKNSSQASIIHNLDDIKTFQTTCNQKITDLFEELKRRHGSRSTQVDTKFDQQAQIMQGGFIEINNKIDALSTLLTKQEPEESKKRSSKNNLMNGFWGFGFLGGAFLNYVYNDTPFSHLLTSGLGLYSFSIFSHALRVQIAKRDMAYKNRLWEFLGSEKTGNYIFNLANILIGAGFIGGAYRNLADSRETAKFIYGYASLGAGMYAGKTVFKEFKSKFDELD